jgi:hypothetical protein
VLGNNAGQTCSGTIRVDNGVRFPADVIGEAVPEHCRWPSRRAGLAPPRPVTMARVTMGAPGIGEIA